MASKHHIGSKHIPRKTGSSARYFLLSLGVLLIALAALSAASCFSGGSSSGTRSIFIAGFAVPGQVVMEKIAPAFAKKWADEHGGEKIDFRYSWGGSSVQARNILAGLDADVAYLSDWTDMNRLRLAKLVPEHWNENGRGIVSRSLVVLRVKKGNPLGIRNWNDLFRSDVRALTPNPKTSGSARWNILALYGAILKTGGTTADAEDALHKLYRNVVTFGESGRATTQDFERGVGDVAITYENEVLLQRKQGHDVEFVIPEPTILIENPAAVVTYEAERHGVTDIAEAFVAYLREPAAQEMLEEYGFRSASATDSPAHSTIFDVEFLGGWEKVEADIFARGALWDRIIRSPRPAPLSGAPYSGAGSQASLSERTGAPEGGNS